jgi:DNA-binding NarL/FixJ family response regulator
VAGEESTNGMLRVLLVEDDERFADSVRAVLSADGRFELVGWARDGGDAVELSEELSPDLVLVDIGLPTMDGVTATREIKKRCPAAQIVMLTGSSERDDFERAERAGAIGYVAKEELGSPELADSLLALYEMS